MATQEQQRAQAAEAILDEAIPLHVVLDATVERQAKRLDGLSRLYCREIAATSDPLRKAMILADGVRKLYDALTPEMMRKFMWLMNKKMGFLTDRPPGNKKNLPEYTEEEVKMVLIEALLKGFYPVNNEFNIIAGGFYAALNGCRRVVLEYPGVGKCAVNPGVPGLDKDSGRCVVRVEAEWEYKSEKFVWTTNGEPGRKFAVNASNNEGPDNLVGKAKRKAYAAIYEQLTGIALPEGEVEVPLAGLGDKLPMPNPGREHASKPNNGNKIPAVESRMAQAPPEPSGSEQKLAEGEIPNEDDKGPGVTVTGLFDAAGDADRQDTIREIEQGIAAAQTVQDLKQVGATMTGHREGLGEETSARLMKLYQAKYTKLQPSASPAPSASRTTKRATSA